MIREMTIKIGFLLTNLRMSVMNIELSMGAICP